MTTALNIIQYIFPVLVVSIAVVLLCFYLQAKKKRATYDVTTPAMQLDNAASTNYTVSREEEEEEEEAEVSRHQDRLPPPYSTMEPPPPYCLFDPKQTGIWPVGLLPAYDMYPTMLPLAPHH